MRFSRLLKNSRPMRVSQPPAKASTARIARTFGGCLCTLAFLAALQAHPAFHIDEVVVLSSMKILPYEQIARGIERELGGAETSILYMDQDPGAPSRILKMTPSVILTVGQDAFKAALPLRGSVPLVFTMVLFPREVLNHPVPGVSGIGMIPSPQCQLLILKNGFHFKHVLMFYNPDLTGFLVEYFRGEVPVGMTLTPEPVASDAALVRRLEAGLGDADAVLLVPDPTVLTEQGLKSLITSCYGSGVPLVGFSPMYLRMGAAVTLSVTEEQTARMAVALASASNVNGEQLGGVYYPLSCQIQVSRKAKSRLGFKVDTTAVRSYGDFEWGD